MSRRRRAGPSSPAEIQAANALRRGELATQQRSVNRSPELWGVSAQILHLPTSADVALTTGARGAIVAANRSDPFDLLLAAGGLTADQHRAARRLFRDWCQRAGVRDRERQALERVDGGRADPSALVSDAMVDAGRRIARAFKGWPEKRLQGVGPVNARLLEYLISPMVDEGRIIVWRWHVQRATGETERHAQGALVRQACEALRLVYEETDAATRPARRPERSEAQLRAMGEAS